MDYETEAIELVRKTPEMRQSERLANTIAREFEGLEARQDWVLQNSEVKVTLEGWSVAFETGEFGATNRTLTIGGPHSSIISIDVAYSEKSENPGSGGCWMIHTARTKVSTETGDVFVVGGQFGPGGRKALDVGLRLAEDLLDLLAD